MKCTKCGAECDSRQLFCLRCGTPIGGNKSEEEIIREVEVPIEDIVDVINLEEEDDDIDLIIGRDLSRVRERNVNVNSSRADYQNTNDSDEEPVSTRRASSENERRPRRNGQNRADSEPVKKESNKKLYIGIGIAAVLLVIVIVVVVIVFGNSGKYDEYYKNGSNLYNKGRIQASITEFNKAANIAKTEEDKVESNVMLWKAYSQLDGYDNELIDVLTTLIELKPDNASYYEALIIVYQGLDKQSAIDELVASVSDAELQQRLLEFDGTTPVATMTEGEYDKPISVGLTAMSGSTIYYTINGGNATTSSETYTTSIDLNEEGEYIIKAIAVDANGKESRQFEGKYVLKFATVNAPVVNLDSGTYNERKKVKVTADDGCTIYYTTDESMPTEESKKYKKAFKIPEDNTVYRFIAIDENGITSDVVTRIYRFERVYEYEYDEAVSRLTDELISKGIMENSFGNYEDGSVMYLEYVTIAEVEEERYYIIKATKEKESGSTISNETYAFGCDNGSVYKAELKDGEYEFSKIKK